MNVRIKYCGQWNYKPRASRLEEELRAAFGADINVELVAGSGGVYEITVDGDIVFSKKTLGRFPEEGEIIALMRHWKSVVAAVVGRRTKIRLFKESLPEITLIEGLSFYFSSIGRHSHHSQAGVVPFHKSR